MSPMGRLHWNQCCLLRCFDMVRRPEGHLAWPIKTFGTYSEQLEDEDCGYMRSDPGSPGPFYQGDPFLPPTVIFVSLILY